MVLAMWHKRIMVNYGHQREAKTLQSVNPDMLS